MRARIGGGQKNWSRLFHAGPTDMRPFRAPCNSLLARSLALPSGIQRPCIATSSASKRDAKLGPFERGPKGVTLRPQGFDHLPLAAACSAAKGSALRALRALGAYQNALPSPQVDWASLKKTAPDSWAAGAHAGERPRPMRGAAIFVHPL